MTTTNEVLAPIQDSSDPRWSELAAWLKQNPSPEFGVVDIDELEPLERATWHDVHVATS